MKPSLDVCIATMDPSIESGVLTATRTMYAFHERWGHVPCLLYVSVMQGVERQAALRGDLSGWRVWEQVSAGMRGIAVGYLCYRYQFLRYLLAAWRANSYLDRFQAYTVVGGTNLYGLPFALSRKRYLCWISTLFEDERKAQVTGGSRNDAVTAMSELLIPMLERMVFENAHKILAMSHYVARQLGQRYQRCSERISVVYPPVDTVRFCPGFDQALAKSGDMKVVLAVGRLCDPRKNPGMLVRAFAIVKRHVPQARLVLVGLPPKPGVVELCRQLGLDSSISIVGACSDQDLVRYYQHADVFALSSLQEGLGLVVLEAMACGLPVVATRCGGPEELVVDGVTGYLVDRNDEQAFAEALTKLLADVSLRQQAGNAGRERVERYFSVEVIDKQLEKAFEQVYPDLLGGA